MSNSPIVSLFRRFAIRKYRVADAIYSIREKGCDGRSISKLDVCFDFSDDKYIHLGDVLFYLPLVLYFGSVTRVYIICSGIKAAILKHLLGKSNSVFTFVDDVPHHSVVVTFPYLLYKYTAGKTPTNIVYGVGLAADIPDLPYPLYLARNLMAELDAMDKYEDLCCNYKRFLENVRSSPLVLPSSPGLPVDFNVVLFSPFISSGKFRDFLQLKFKKLIGVAKELAGADAKICLVGGRNDSPIADLAIIDLRGMDIGELLEWARLPNVIYGFGFDNFWMHYLDIIDKPYNVMFRGRYTIRARMIHYNSINVAFCSRLPRNYIVS